MFEKSWWFGKVSGYCKKTSVTQKINYLVPDSAGTCQAKALACSPTHVPLPLHRTWWGSHLFCLLDIAGCVALAPVLCVLSDQETSWTEMELQVCALSASRMQLADMYRASSSRSPTIIPPALTGSCFHNCIQGYCSTEDKSSLGAALSFFPSQNLQVPSHLPLPVGTPKPPPQLLHPTNRGRSCDPRLSAACLPKAHQGTVAFTAHIQNSTNHRQKPHCQKDHT